VALSIESTDPVAERARLEKIYPDVYDTGQLTEQFSVLGFMAPFCVVIRKSDQKRGSVEFQHFPRFYFNFFTE